MASVYINPDGSAGQNGTGKFYDDISISDIKNKAKEAVQRETRGATSLSMIRGARFQYDQGKDHEQTGDLKSALGSFIKAASLARTAIGSTDGGGGPLQKELNEFMAVCVHVG